MKRPTLLLFLLAALGSAGAVRAEETTAKLAFSDPSKPGILKIRVGRADIRIKGTDTRDISVASDSGGQAAPRKDGLRVLTSSAGYRFDEKDNVAIMEYEGSGRAGPAKFSIAVPARTSIVLSSAWGGDVSCSGLSGDVEIKNLNGDVTLSRLSGGALVETMSGAIKAGFSELHEGRPLSFTSMNGTVSLAIPAVAKANIVLRTQNGSILTDFDEKALSATTAIQPGARSRVQRPADEDWDELNFDEEPRPGMEGGRLDPKTKQAIREAARQSAEAAKEAAQALREAAQAARDGMADAGVIPPVPPVPPLPPMTGGKTVTGTLNGGGALIQVATMNGDVILRRAADEKESH